MYHQHLKWTFFTDHVLGFFILFINLECLLLLFFIISNIWFVFFIIKKQVKNWKIILTEFIHRSYYSMNFLFSQEKQQNQQKQREKKQTSIANNKTKILDSFHLMMMMLKEKKRNSSLLAHTHQQWWKMWIKFEKFLYHNNHDD